MCDGSRYQLYLLQRIRAIWTLIERATDTDSMNDSSFPTAHDGDPLAAAGTGKSSRNLAATWTPVNLPPSPYFYGPLISSSSLSDDITDNDVQDEEELDLDLHGRKHVLIGPEQDGIYGMNGTALRSVKLADIQEKEVEKEFRDYITNFVPPEMITNDYGKVLPIDEFQPHELARLQAKLWVDIPRANAENRSPLGSLTREDTLMGAVIDLIAKKLAGGMLFFHCATCL